MSRCDVAAGRCQEPPRRATSSQPGPAPPQPAQVRRLSGITAPASRSNQRWLQDTRVSSSDRIFGRSLEHQHSSCSIGRPTAYSHAYRSYAQCWDVKLCNGPWTPLMASPLVCRNQAQEAAEVGTAKHSASDQGMPRPQFDYVDDSLTPGLHWCLSMRNVYQEIPSRSKRSSDSHWSNT